jgi:hypothetical protein
MSAVADAPVTVNIAVPVTTDPLVVFVYEAVMVAVPEATAVAIPVLAPMVATAVPLDVQETEVVRTSVATAEVVPIALNGRV